MAKGASHERQLTRAVGLVIDLLAATAARTQGGTRSETECLGCERTGVHKPELRCLCACHAARAYLAELLAETEAA